MSVGGSDAVSVEHFSSFNYVAYGHLHRPQRVGKNGAYSGSLFKYSFSESKHNKSVSIVDIDGQGNVKRREVSLSPKRDVRVLQGDFQTLLNTDPGSGRDDYILARLDDTEALYDPLAQLRKVYPNVLQIERPAPVSYTHLTLPTICSV